MHYYITTLTKKPANVPEEWLAEAKRLTKHACGHEDRTVFLDPVIVDDIGEDVAMSFVRRLAIGFVRQELLDALPEIERYCELGKLVDTSGKEIAGCRTIRRNYDVRIRGGKKSQCRVCEECGQVIYYPIGTWYLMKDDLPDQPLFAAALNGLIIAEQLHNRLADSRFKRVSIRKIPVLDRPRDGQPADLNDLLG